MKTKHANINTHIVTLQMTFEQSKCLSAHQALYSNDTTIQWRITIYFTF
jgi:hypothetical protein